MSMTLWALPNTAYQNREIFLRPYDL